jgi:hypothetical protein
MFEARLKLTGRDVSFHVMTKSGLKKVSVDDDARKKKLGSLLRVCKQQKFTVEVSHVFEEGEMVAYVGSSI